MPVMPDLMTAKEVAGILKITREHLWKMAGDGRFPRPVYITRKAPRWRAEVVNAWLSERPDRPAAA